MNKIYGRLIWTKAKSPSIDDIIEKTMKYARENKPVALEHKLWIETLQSCPGFMGFRIEKTKAEVEPSNGTIFNEYKMVAMFDTMENTVMAKLTL